MYGVENSIIILFPLTIISPQTLWKYQKLILSRLLKTNLSVHILRNKDNLKIEDNLKSKYDPKIEDNLENENDLQNEDDIKD